MVTALVLVLLWCVGLSCSELVKNNDTTETQDRVYFMKKCGGPGCPYTASWLAHINLYKKIPWWLDSTKMEAASFNMCVLPFLCTHGSSSTVIEMLYTDLIGRSLSFKYPTPTRTTFIT
jgi:hypothetical protein